MVTYEWEKVDEIPDSFEKTCHGNATSIKCRSRPFIRTAPSTISSMRATLTNGVTNPTLIYEDALNNSGGPFRSNSQSEEPRDMAQVSYSY